MLQPLSVEESGWRQGSETARGLDWTQAAGVGDGSGVAVGVDIAAGCGASGGSGVSDGADAGLGEDTGLRVGTDVGVGISMGTGIEVASAVGSGEGSIALVSVGSATTAVGVDVNSGGTGVADSVGTATEVTTGGAACSPPQPARENKAMRQAEISIGFRQHPLILASCAYTGDSPQ